LQNANLAHYSGYSESMIIPTANLMLNYILRPIKHESFFKKYAGRRYLKVSPTLLPSSIFDPTLCTVERLLEGLGAPALAGEYDSRSQGGFATAESGD
jgi:hypothetical protein